MNSAYSTELNWNTLLISPRRLLGDVYKRQANLVGVSMLPAGMVQPLLGIVVTAEVTRGTRTDEPLEVGVS